MTLNLDLSKFSKKELQDEITSCSEILGFINGNIREANVVYEKLLIKRFVRPLRLATAKSNVDNYRLLKTINDKYSRLLLDESNKRSRSDRDKKEGDAKTN